MGRRGYAGVRVAESLGLREGGDEWEAGLREVSDEFARSLRRGASLRFSLVVARRRSVAYPKRKYDPYL